MISKDEKAVDVYAISELMQDDSRIDQILLFGSCACGNVRKGSDIAIAIITKEQLDLNEELSFYDYLIDIYPKDYIPNDMIIMSRKQYDEHKYSSGYVQKYIYRDGLICVNLYEEACKWYESAKTLLDNDFYQQCIYHACMASELYLKSALNLVEHDPDMEISHDILGMFVFPFCQ